MRLHAAIIYERILFNSKRLFSAPRFTILRDSEDFAVEGEAISSVDCNHLFSARYETKHLHRNAYEPSTQSVSPIQSSAKRILFLCNAKHFKHNENICIHTSENVMASSRKEEQKYIQYSYYYTACDPLVHTHTFPCRTYSVSGADLRLEQNDEV